MIRKKQKNEYYGKNLVKLRKIRDYFIQIDEINAYVKKMNDENIR